MGPISAAPVPSGRLAHTGVTVCDRVSHSHSLCRPDEPAGRAARAPPTPLSAARASRPRRPGPTRPRSRRPPTANTAGWSGPTLLTSTADRCRRSRHLQASCTIDRPKAHHASPDDNIYPRPHVIFRTKGRRGTRETAIESSYQDVSNQYSTYKFL